MAAAAMRYSPSWAPAATTPRPLWPSARTGRYRLTIADLDSPTPRAAVAAINTRG